MEEEIYDNIDYDPQEEMIYEEDHISKLCFPIYNATEMKPIGSGVIVNKKGIFISAAHNFIEQSVLHLAHYNGKSYDIKILYIEYDFGKLDLAIGYLKNFDEHILNEEDEPILDSTDSLYVGSDLTLTGCKSASLCDAELIDNIQITDRIVIRKQRVFKKVLDVQEGDILYQIIKEHKNTIIPFEDFSQDRNLEGFSGGPVYQDKTLYGIILSHFFLKIDYIKEKLKMLRII